MIYNKTCLFSSNAGVSGCDLSEPLSAFERYVVKVSPGVYWESSLTGNKSVQRFNRYGDWNHQGYMIWPANWVISNNTQHMECNRFQMLSQNSASNQINAFGWGNTASNVKHLFEVWGINKKDYTSAIGSGYPGDTYTAYNETLLWSGDDRPSAIALSGRGIEYDRIKIGVGSEAESRNIYEVDSPTTYTSWLPLYSYWGATTASFYVNFHRYRWGDETSGLSAISGKTFQLGTAAASPYTAGGNYTSTDGFVRRPVWAVWGINKKPTHTVTLINGQHGSIGATRITGVENDEVTLSNTADEDWYFSGYSITGAQLTGNQFIINNSDVTVEGNWNDEGYPITYLSDAHVHLTGDQIYTPGNEGITLDSGYDTYYRISGYDITGGSLVNGKLVATGPCTIKAVEKVNYFTATGNFDKGSNVTVTGVTGKAYTTFTTKSVQKFAKFGSKTGDVSTSYWSDSNTWNPSNCSAYSITIKAAMQIKATAYTAGTHTAWDFVRTTASVGIGNSVTNTAYYHITQSTATWNYSKTVTTTAQSTYSVSANMATNNYPSNLKGFVGTATYIAAGTTGTWTATGIAP